MPRYRAWKFGPVTFVAFGVLALVIAAVEVYSVIAYAMTQRHHEVSISVTLGAALALLVGRWIEPLLFAQSLYDPRIIGSVGALMLGGALVATPQPTWRAAQVDPTRTLPEE